MVVWLFRKRRSCLTIRCLCSLRKPRDFAPPERSMVQDSEFATLMAQVQGGCTASAQILHDRYGTHILRAVRRLLHQRLRPKFDSIDFVQDVWVSFFADIPHGCAFREPEDLIAYLTTLARNKVAETFRTRLQRQKYNVNRECYLGGNPASVKDLRGNDPTPSEVVMGKEAWDVLLENQTPVHRHILTMLREGKEPQDIAQELGISQKTVQRVVHKHFPGARL